MPLLPGLAFEEQYWTAGGSIGGYDAYDETRSPYNGSMSALAQEWVDRAAATGASLTSKTIVIVGCGFGYSLGYLRQKGVNAFGIDISQWAYDHAPAEAKPYMVRGDARLSEAWTSVRALAGFTRGNQRFDVAVSEDMLCCLSDADAVTLHGRMTTNSRIVLHLNDEADNFAQWYNYHSNAEWKAILGSGKFINRQTGTVT